MEPSGHFAQRVVIVDDGRDPKPVAVILSQPGHLKTPEV